MAKRPLYAILRVKKLHSIATISAAGSHQQRTRPTPNADPNGEIRQLAGPSDAKAAVGAILTGLKTRPTAASVLAVEVFMSASPEFFRPDNDEYGAYDPAKTDTWTDHSMRWLRTEWGDGNIASATLHLDEATPHIHALVVPVDPETGRLNAKRWLGGAPRMRAIQTRHAAALHDLGLVRGTERSRAHHTEVQEHYAAIRSLVTAVPPATVRVPPIQMLPGAREQWAQRESQRIRDEQQPAIDVLSAKARSFDEATRRNAEIQGTLQDILKRTEAERARTSAQSTMDANDLRQLNDRLAEQRAIADRLRPVPLDQVAGLFPSGHLAKRGLRIASLKDGKTVIADIEKTKVLGRNSIDLIMLAADTDFVGALSFIKTRAPEAMRDRFGPDLGQFLLAHHQAQTGIPDHLRQRIGRIVTAVAPGKFPEVLRASQDAGFEWLPDARGWPCLGDLWLTGQMPMPDELKTRLTPVADDLQRHVIEVYHRMQQNRRGPRR